MIAVPSFWVMSLPHQQCCRRVFMRQLQDLLSSQLQPLPAVHRALLLLAKLAVLIVLLSGML